MDGTRLYQISLCTACTHHQTGCAPGYALIQRLQDALNTAGDSLSDGFEISGVAHMTSCGQPCTLAYLGTARTSYLFGDVDPDTDIADLVAFARRQMRARPEGGRQVSEYPKGPGSRPLARPPAAIIAVENRPVRLS